MIARFKLALEGPKAEGGVADVEEFLAIGEAVETVLELVKVVMAEGVIQVAGFEANGADGLSAELRAVAIGDAEAAFAGAVDEMGGGD